MATAAKVWRRQAGYPGATKSSSLLKYPTGCWEGPLASVRTPKAMPFLFVTYRL